ncbi:phosphoribosylanthranilate isomerase [bacterium]|nr:phosphoribosylanthranilate isomerase [bacterium]
MYNTFEIKICGINDEITMITAIECKVDYIGLVFYEKSPRNVTIDYSKKLLNNRNSHTKIVALTVDPDDNYIADLKKNIKPDYLQLHGNETPNRCKEIKTIFDIPIIKGIGINNKLDLVKANEEYQDICDIMLLDSPSTTLPGGNGTKFDWKVLESYKSQKKWMLAGGLNVENIHRAVKVSNPPAIDISSGVEVSKGKKTAELIKDFVMKCRSI